LSNKNVTFNFFSKVFFSNVELLVQPGDEKASKTLKLFIFLKKVLVRLFPIELFPKKMKVFFFFSFFRKSYTFLFLTTCRKNFFEKIFSFCYFFHFWSFLLILDKNEQKLGHFDQIYGTSTEMKKNQKMLIFRLQTVLRCLKWRRPCYVAIC